jgi:hypothetical protein
MEISSSSQVACMRCDRRLISCSQAAWRSFWIAIFLVIVGGLVTPVEVRASPNSEALARAKQAQSANRRQNTRLVALENNSKIHQSRIDSVFNVLSTSLTSLGFTIQTDGLQISVEGAVGPQGPQGPQGPAGPGVTGYILQNQPGSPEAFIPTGTGNLQVVSATGVAAAFCALGFTEFSGSGNCGCFVVRQAGNTWHPGALRWGTTSCAARCKLNCFQQ